jgi:cytidylate kinase
VQRRGLVVAIDGPSGSGKSTVARSVAAARGLRYLDTGAMYRAITWLALRDGRLLDDADGLAALAQDAELAIGTDPAAVSVVGEGIELSAAVRGEDVTRAVSLVSAVPQVRHTMVDRQRVIIGAGDIVVEGRDIGTTVAPDAEVKVFLTADAATRAARRTDQEGRSPGLAPATQADLHRRDEADSTRTASPLRRASDAIEIDSSALGVDEVVAVVLHAVDVARATAAGNSS